MECQHDYLAKLDEDILTLTQVSTKINELITTDDEIQQTLSGMANVINDVVIVNGNLNLKLQMLNDTSKMGIDNMNIKINKELADLYEKRKDAFWEDFWYHIFHPFG